jgi:hypothetical protein
MAFWQALIAYLSSENWVDDLAVSYFDSLTPAEIAAEFESVFVAGNDEFKREVALELQAMVIGTMASFYNAMFTMAYEAPITEWIARAVRGDLASYYKAYHVAQTVAARTKG